MLYGHTKNITSPVAINPLVRMVMAVGATKGNFTRAIQGADSTPSWYLPSIAEMLKAAVDPGSTTDATFAGPLANLQTAATQFVALLRAQSVLGRMTGFRRVPFQIKFPRQTAGSSVGWVGEGLSKPVSELVFESAELGFAKIGGIVVLSQELMLFGRPDCESLVQADLTASIAAFEDQAFLDPTATAVLNVSPASITSGATSIPSSGSSAGAVETDLKALVQVLVTAGCPFIAPYFVMRASTALHLATLRTSGQRVFPDVSVKGGSIWGIPVIPSDNVKLSAPTGDASFMTLVDADSINLAEAGIELDSSANAVVQMNSTPSAGAQNQVSLWQNNLVGVRCERYINWGMRRSGMVAVLSNVQY